MARQLRDIRSVSISEEVEITPDLSAILRDLESDPPRVEQAQRRLERLITALDSAPGGVAEAETALSEVMARPEFRRNEQESPGESLGHRIEEILRWPFEKLADGFDWLDRRFGGSSEEGDSGSDRWIILGGIWFLIMVALGLVVRRRSRESSRSRPVSSRALTSDQPLPAKPAQALRQEANRLAEAGQFRLALRSLYLATLFQWHDRSRIGFNRTLTDHEILEKAVSRGENQAAVLQPVVQRFEGHWFGRIPCGPREYQEFTELADAAWEPSR